MQISLDATTPRTLLNDTLKFLAEKVGGYKDGNDFIDQFDILIHGSPNAQDFDIAERAVISMIARIDGPAKLSTKLSICSLT